MQTKLRNLEDEASSFESYVVQSRVFPSLRSKKRLKSSERGAKVREHVMVLLLLDNIYIYMIYDTKNINIEVYMMYFNSKL